MKAGHDDNVVNGRSFHAAEEKPRRVRRGRGAGPRGQGRSLRRHDKLCEPNPLQLLDQRSTGTPRRLVRAETVSGGRLNPVSALDGAINMIGGSFVNDSRAPIRGTFKPRHSPCGTCGNSTALGLATNGPTGEAADTSVVSRCETVKRARPASPALQRPFRRFRQSRRIDLWSNSPDLRPSSKWLCHHQIPKIDGGRRRGSPSDTTPHSR